MFYVTTCSLTQGRRAGAIAALGIQVSNLLHTIAVALGVSVLIAASPPSLAFIKCAGAIYFIYLGLRSIVNTVEVARNSPTERANLKSIFYQGLLINLLNPIPLLFFLTFLPQFVNPVRGSVTTQLLLLGVTYGVIRVPVDMILILGGNVLGRRLKAYGRAQALGKWLTGLVFVAFGVGMACAA